MEAEKRDPGNEVGNYSEIRDERKFTLVDVCYLWQGACAHFVLRDSSAYHMRDKMSFALNI